MTPREEMNYFDPEKGIIETYYRLSLGEYEGWKFKHGIVKPHTQNNVPINKEGSFLCPDEDYEIWCENHPCPECDGEGCGHCDGSGIDPNAESPEFDEE